MDIFFSYACPGQIWKKIYVKEVRVTINRIINIIIYIYIYIQYTIILYMTNWLLLSLRFNNIWSKATRSLIFFFRSVIQLDPIYAPKPIQKKKNKSKLAFCRTTEKCQKKDPKYASKKILKNLFTLNANKIILLFLIWYDIVNVSSLTANW